MKSLYLNIIVLDIDIDFICCNFYVRFVSEVFFEAYVDLIIRS